MSLHVWALEHTLFQAGHSDLSPCFVLINRHSGCWSHFGAFAKQWLPSRQREDKTTVLKGLKYLQKGVGHAQNWTSVWTVLLLAWLFSWHHNKQDWVRPPPKKPPWWWWFCRFQSVLRGRWAWWNFMLLFKNKHTPHPIPHPPKKPQPKPNRANKQKKVKNGMTLDLKFLRESFYTVLLVMKE